MLSVSKRLRSSTALASLNRLFVVPPTTLPARGLVGRYADIRPLRTFHSTKPVIKSSRQFHFDAKLSAKLNGQGGSQGGGDQDINEITNQPIRFSVPQRVRQKLISASDAVSLVHDGDTVCVSGFVTHGAPEAVLKALGERFDKDASPSNLTLLFGGGPGDFGERGLSHLAKEKGDKRMLKRTIGGHYGQVPKVAEMALSNKVEAWALPMGSISRMIRAQSTHSPGHITTVGLSTFADPDISGGAANEKALQSPLHSQLVSKLTIDGQTNLCYKALPINVAIIRGTTADSQGNISMEQEPLLADQKIMATAAKNSGGLVIAQVKRVAADGTLSSRKIDIPAPLVDCVVVVDEEDHKSLHGMSYFDDYNPSLTGEIVTNVGELDPMPMGVRKIIARRAFFRLKPNKIVNLGIGLPEGVASVAAEEGMLNYVTLSTEAGSFGGIPASGHLFGPSYNASSLIEMNQMFDFYDGGGLDMTFLGAAQISESGDVNVSRMSKDRLTGAGGFIDIVSSTKNIVFMSSFTTKGLKISTSPDGKLNIEKEGEVKKFVNSVYETTFSGDEAVRRGQKVYYVTERAVFRRSAEQDTIELIEIAPGVDLKKDILDQMDFKPAVSPNLRVMDRRIFCDTKMKAIKEFFGSLEERCNYHSDDHVMYLELFGITLNSQEDVDWFFGSLRDILRPLVDKKGPIDMVVNYDGFDLSSGLESYYGDAVAAIEGDLYKSVKRYTGHAFRKAQLKSQLSMNDWDPNKLFDKFDKDGSNYLDIEELRSCFEMFQIHITPTILRMFRQDENNVKIDREMFVRGIEKVLESTN